MLNTLDILAIMRSHVKTRTGSGTDYRIAKELNCSAGSLVAWNKGGSIAPEYAIKIAVYCDLDPRYLVACVEFEKARNQDTRDFWQALAADFGPQKRPRHLKIV